MSGSRDVAALPRFIALFAVMYAAFGVASPFLPAFLGTRGLSPDEIGVVLAASTAIRLISGPSAGRLADWLAALRAVLAVCCVLAAIAAVAYLPAPSFWFLLVVGLAHAAALAPITTLADALALTAAHRTGFEYGWVRGAGSGAFIVGSIVAGQAVAAAGLGAIVWLQASLLVVAAGCAMLVAEPTARSQLNPQRGRSAGVGALLRLRPFRRVVLVAALVLGSHAMHDSFAVIRWSAAGIDPGTASVLWSEAVAAEVVVFLLIGPALVARLGPAGAVMLAAAAGVLRWVVMANSAEVTVMALVQPLHGLTFALLHLACMRLIGAMVPPGLAATAQAIYGTLGIGAATALMTLASGFLYSRFGAAGFYLMALLCAAGIPLAFGLRR